SSALFLYLPRPRLPDLPSSRPPVCSSAALASSLVPCLLIQPASVTSVSNPDMQTVRPGFRPAPFEGRFIEANGVRLHYLDYGTAGLTPMLCLHGGAVNAHWFDFVPAAFPPPYPLPPLHPPP